MAKSVRKISPKKRKALRLERKALEKEQASTLKLLNEKRDELWRYEQVVNPKRLYVATLENQMENLKCRIRYIKEQLGK